MHRFLAALIVLGVAMSAVSHAQTPTPAPAKKPDFSGTWTFQRADDGRGGPGGGRGAFGLGLEFTVTQDDKTIAVVGTATRGGPTRSEYKLDGSVTDNGGSASRISWDGSKLVITMGNRRQVWVLDATGSILAIETTTAGIDQPTKVWYTRK